MSAKSQSLGSRDQEMGHLINSIETKLNMLAGDTLLKSADDAEQKPHSDQMEIQFSHSKPIQLSDLESSPLPAFSQLSQSAAQPQFGSSYVQPAENTQHNPNNVNPQSSIQISNPSLGNVSQFSNSSLRVIHRINLMQEYYMKQLSEQRKQYEELEYRVVYLQDKNKLLQERCQQLSKEMAKYRAVAQIREADNQQILERQIEGFKVEIFAKFSKEAETQYETHIAELSSVNEELFAERKQRRYLQEQVRLLRSEKDYLQEFYRQLLNNHRDMIKLDMRNDREQKHGPSKRVVNGKAGSYEEIGNRQLINPHKKEKSKNGFKKSPVSNSQSKKDELGEISKQQLIPFLAKGIEELKQKLNMH